MKEKSIQESTLNKSWGRLNTSALLISQKGFSLIEILVALSMIGVILIAIPLGVNDNSRAELEEAIDGFDRAVRFASNEAVLKNTIVRIKVDTEKETPEYVIEAADNGKLVLLKQVDEEKLSLKEKKYLDAKKKKQEAKFQPIQEFKEASKPIAENVTLVGMTSEGANQIKTEGPYIIYFYPTGEKDAATILLATDYEVAGIDVRPFQNNTVVKYLTLNQDQIEDDLFEAQLALAKEMIEVWKN